MVSQCLTSIQCLNAYTNCTLLKKQTEIQEKIQADFYFNAFTCGGNEESDFSSAAENGRNYGMLLPQLSHKTLWLPFEFLYFGWLKENRKQLHCGIWTL